jgi:hypothetical protein
MIELKAPIRNPRVDVAGVSDAALINVSQVAAH